MAITQNTKKLKRAVRDIFNGLLIHNISKEEIALAHFLKEGVKKLR